MKNSLNKGWDAGAEKRFRATLLSRFYNFAPEARIE